MEQVSGNPQAAREAQQQALATFLTYRRDGGENHSSARRIGLGSGTSDTAGVTVKNLYQL